MTYLAEQIGQYGALQQHSAQRHEHAHEANLTDDWNPSNHNLQYLPQGITLQHRILRVNIRELNV